MNPPRLLIRILGWVLPVLVPVLLILTSVRALMTPAYVRLEYRMPAFPEDPYGFTRQERVKWATVALEYLLTDEDISFLGDLEFEDGSPLYNDRELRHMQDVKVLTDIFLGVWLAGLAFVVTLGVWAWFGGWWADFRRMLAQSGRVAVYIVVALAVLLVVSFNTVFVGFHRIFFEGDTWLFRFSDTLIRLFPLRFWQDVFLFLSALTLLGGLALWLLANTRRPDPANQLSPSKSEPVAD